MIKGPEPGRAEVVAVWPIVLIYVVIASLWVGWADSLIALWAPDPAQAGRIDTIKDWTFIALSGVILYGLMRRLVGQLQRSSETERLAQLAKNQARDLLATIGEHTPDAIFAKDLSGRYVVINSAVGRLLGRPAEFLLGKDASAAFPASELPAIRAKDEQVMAQDRPETFEETVTTAIGRCTFMTTKGPLRDRHGQVTGLFGIARDITDRRAAADELAERERRYRLLFAASPHPMWMMDRETLRFLAVNDALLDLSGYTREEMRSLSPLDITHEDDRARLRARLTAWQTGEIAGMFHGGVWRQLHKDGHVVEVEIDSNDLTIDGRPVRVSTARDVTQVRELKRRSDLAHAEALASRDLLRDVLARVDDGFVALDADWRYTYCNDKAAKMLGRERPEDLIGRHIWTEFPDGVGQPFHRVYQEAMATQQPARFEALYGPWNRCFENRVYPSPDGLSIYFTDVTDQRRAEAALRHREKSFRLLAEQMPAIIYRAPLEDGRRELYISPYVRILGYTPEQWMTQPGIWLQCLHPDDRDRVLADRRAGVASGGEFRLEYRMRDAAGGWRHFRDTARRVDPDDGSASYLQGVSIDITDHVEAEIALRDSEAQLQLSERRYRLAAVEDRVWEWDADSGVIRTSPMLWRVLGGPEPAKQRAFDELSARMPAEDLQRMQDALRRHFAERVPYDIEFRVRDDAGAWHWFHSIGQAVWDQRGRAVYMAGTTMDIDDRKQAEAALRKAEAYRRTLFEQLADGVLLVDHARRILDANPQAMKMLGWPGGLSQDLTLERLLSAHDRDRIDEDMQDTLAGRSSLLEWEIVRRDGTRFPAEVSARAMDDDRYIAVLRDITSRRQAERALLSYQLELSELTQRLLTQEKLTTQRVAQMLHDNLGQTLAVARLNLDAAIATGSEEMPSKLRTQCQTVSRLLDNAVRETRHVLADLRPPLLDEQGLMAALDNEVQQRGVAGAPTDLLLEADEHLLGQRWPGDVEYGSFMIAREAIANAQRHAGATLVRVVLSGDDHRMTLDIIDDGIGIPSHLQTGRPGHLGMVGMRERAIAIGARLDVSAGAEGGTRVQLRWAA